MLASVGLAGKADELAANLSHGEQRNLEIGIALATEPQLLCLDEPTAGMSAAETHDTMQLVRRIAKDLTILIVEHDMQVVMGLADRITVLHYGEVLADGTPAEIQQNPARAGGLSQDMSAPDTAHRASRRRSRTSTPTTARATSCTASRSRSAAARWWACSGRNGVGKSTTLKTIMGLVNPSAGHGHARGPADHRHAAAQARASSASATCRRTGASSGC